MYMYMYKWIKYTKCLHNSLKVGKTITQCDNNTTQKTATPVHMALIQP